MGAAAGTPSRFALAEACLRGGPRSATALVVDDGSRVFRVTFGELEDLSRRAASDLLARGLEAWWLRWHPSRRALA